MAVEHVSGRKVGDLMLYALSTCQWCNKTKELLRELGVDFNFVYVDLLEGEEQDKVLTELERWNPRGSFPTLVISNARCIIGYQEGQIREEFGT